MTEQSSNANLPAMPFEVVDEVQSSRWWSGMTKREMFAMSAMQGLCTHKDYLWFGDAAKAAVKYADALLAELEKEQN